MRLAVSKRNIISDVMVDQRLNLLSSLFVFFLNELFGRSRTILVRIFMRRYTLMAMVEVVRIMYWIFEVSSVVTIK